MRHVIITQDEDGIYIANCPSLPGCRSQGDTLAEALENIKDAIQLWMESAIAHGDEIPADYAIVVGAVAVETPTKATNALAVQ